jgi:hypothetical protein
MTWDNVLIIIGAIAIVQGGLILLSVRMGYHLGRDAHNLPIGINKPSKTEPIIEQDPYQEALEGDPATGRRIPTV